MSSSLNEEGDGGVRTGQLLFYHLGKLEEGKRKAAAAAKRTFHSKITLVGLVFPHFPAPPSNELRGMDSLQSEIIFAKEGRTRPRAAFKAKGPFDRFIIHNYIRDPKRRRTGSPAAEALLAD